MVKCILDNWIIAQTIDLSTGVADRQVWPNALMVRGDNDAHTWEVTVLNNESAADLSLCAAWAYINRSDDTTIPLTGTVDGNIVRVRFRGECYAVDGPITGILRITSGDTTMTIAAFRAYVGNGMSDNIVDTGEFLPSLDDMVSKIQQMETIAESVRQNAMAVDMNTGLSKVYYQYAQDAWDGAAQAYNETIGYASESADNAAKAAQYMQRTLESETAAGNHMIAAMDSATNAARSQQDAHIAYESAVAAADRAEAAAQVDDTVAAYNRQWSSKITVDRLCPEFKESGPYVECRPVEGYPLEVTSKIEAVQAGSGDPSLDNVREIIGYDSVKLTRCGKNLLGFEDYEVTSGNGSYTDSCTDGVFTRVVNVATTPGSFILKSAIPYLKSNHFPAGTYIFTINQSSTGITFNSDRMRIKMELEDGTTTELAHGDSTEITQSGKITDFAYTSSGNFNAGDVVTFTIQLERSDTATEHELYSGSSYDAVFPGTVCGGQFNWATGELTTEWEHRVLDGTEGWNEFKHANTSKNYYYLILGAKNVRRSSTQRTFF